jgi:hypothetical protein
VRRGKWVEKRVKRGENVEEEGKVVEETNVFRIR